MGAYDYEIRQAMREIAQEIKGLRREIKAIHGRLSTSGGLTAATTRRAHLIVDGDKERVFCSACGGVHGTWYDDVRTTLGQYGQKCECCQALLNGDPEFVSGGADI